MKQECFVISGSGGFPLQCTLWLPEKKVRGVLYVIHGMTEHMGRYRRLAEVLTGCGLAVGGFDLRGHGRNEGDPDCASFGEGGWDATLEDMHLFRGWLKERFPEHSQFMLGFSLGSFLLRDYFSRYGTDGVAGAVIMGTGDQSLRKLKLAKTLMKLEIKKCGFDGSTTMVRKLSFDTYNKRYIPGRTRADWLNSDETEVDAYLEDPLCREGISAGLFLQLLEAMTRMCEANVYDNWNKAMPIMLLSGIDDPVGDYGEGTERLEAAMEAAGFTCLKTRVFPIVRHDLLHEEHSRTALVVRSMIAEFMYKHM